VLCETQRGPDAIADAMAEWPPCETQSSMARGRMTLPHGAGILCMSRHCKVSLPPSDKDINRSRKWDEYPIVESAATSVNQLAVNRVNSQERIS
jgi:hypothetical protein